MSKRAKEATAEEREWIVPMLVERAEDWYVRATSADEARRKAVAMDTTGGEPHGVREAVNWQVSGKPEVND